MKHNGHVHVQKRDDKHQQKLHRLEASNETSRAYACI